MLKHSVSFIDIEGDEEFVGKSRKNLYQAKEVEKLCNNLIKAGIKPKDIGIITPYRA